MDNDHHDDVVTGPRPRVDTWHGLQPKGAAQLGEGRWTAWNNRLQGRALEPGIVAPALKPESKT